MGPHCMSTDRLPQPFQSERWLTAALDQALEAIAILDVEEGIILHSNAAFAQTFGDPGQMAPEPRPGQRPGQRLLDLFRPDGEGLVLPAALQQARSGQAWMGCILLMTAAGQPTRFELAVSPVRDEEDAIQSLVVRLRDITAEVEKDRNLRLAQKMNSLGALAGGVAHDFNNLIGAILHHG